LGLDLQNKRNSIKEVSNMSVINEHLLSLVKDGIDLHTHSSPSIFTRKMTDWQLIDQAKLAGFGGVVLKSHESQTADRAQVLQMKMADFHVFGGIVCNEFVGGLNASAVDAAVKMGARIVWMPTFSSSQHIQYFAGKGHGKFFDGGEKLYHSEQGISILDENGKLKTEVMDILDIIEKKNIILSTGHISVTELRELAKEVFHRKIEKFLITHADLGIARVPLDMQKELVRQGAYIEKCYLACCGGMEDVPLDVLVQSINELSSERCVLVTDFGQHFNPSPVEGMLNYIEKLLQLGVGEPDIRRMFVDNPRGLLGI
jgi:hypothetical protein